MKEFNLSSRIYNNFIKKFPNGDVIKVEDTEGFMKEKDVKEFIRLLKEETSCKGQGNCLVLSQHEIREIIDKLAGDDLNGKN